MVVFCGCQSLSRHRIRADSRDEMVSAVLKRITIGSRLLDAQKTMEAAGFKCTLRSNAYFSEDPGFIGDDREKYRSIQDARLLFCARTESAGFLMSNIWNVAIVVDDTDNVKDVLVLHRMEGP